MLITDVISAESTMIEYKESLETGKPRSWLKTVSAFANTSGGTIVFGIKANKALTGLEDIDKTSSKVAEYINARIQPTPRYELVPIEEKSMQFLAVIVGDGPTVPYYYVNEGSRIAYIRRGDQSIEAPIHTLNALILKGQNNTFDALPSPFSLENVSFTLLEATFQKETKESFYRDRDLQSFGLVLPDGKLTYAGALLCDQGLLRQSRVFCTRWKGKEKGTITEDALDDKEYQGNIIMLLENAETFIRNNSRTRWSIRGMTREELSDYPRTAVREALVNAIIHRDYQMVGSEIHVDMYDDRLEIFSPGGMVDGQRIQDLDLRHIPSIRRNQIISDLFNRLHLMERRGSGITRIFRNYEGLSIQPVFFSDSTQFLVTLPNKNFVESAETVTLPGETVASIQEIEQSRFGIRVIADLEEVRVKTQIGVLKLFQQFGYEHPFNRENVAEQFSVGIDRASQIIRLLLKKEFIAKLKRNQYIFIKKE